MGKHFLRHIREAKYIDLILCTSVSDGHFFDRSIDAISSVVDEDIDVSLFLYDGVDEVRDIALDCDVQAYCVSAEGFEVSHLSEATGSCVDCVTVSDE